MKKLRERMPGDVQKLDWLPPWPYPEAHLDGPRTAVLCSGHPENRQISQTNQTGTTEDKHPQIYYYYYYHHYLALGRYNPEGANKIKKVD